jgi:hypothetical protein
VKNLLNGRERGLEGPALRDNRRRDRLRWSVLGLGSFLGCLLLGGLLVLLVLPGFGSRDFFFLLVLLDFLGCWFFRASCLGCSWSFGLSLSAEGPKTSRCPSTSMSRIPITRFNAPPELPPVVPPRKSSPPSSLHRRMYRYLSIGRSTSSQTT